MFDALASALDIISSTFTFSSLPISDFLYSLFSFIFSQHTLPAMETEPWEVLVHKKQLEGAAKIPTEWRISEQLSQISEISGMNVLDVPR